MSGEGAVTQEGVSRCVFRDADPSSAQTTPVDTVHTATYVSEDTVRGEIIFKIVLR